MFSCIKNTSLWATVNLHTFTEIHRTVIKFELPIKSFVQLSPRFLVLCKINLHGSNPIIFAKGWLTLTTPGWVTMCHDFRAAVMKSPRSVIMLGTFKHTFDKRFTLERHQSDSSEDWRVSSLPTAEKEQVGAIHPFSKLPQTGNPFSWDSEICSDSTMHSLKENLSQVGQGKRLREQPISSLKSVQYTSWFSAFTPLFFFLSHPFSPLLWEREL